MAKGGVNLRKGPAVTYSRITTVPQYAIVTATYSAGEYWYYVTYNGKSGWMSGMDNYLGFENKYVLIHYESVNIYSSDGKKVLGTIPANTEINNSLELSAWIRNRYKFYVSYNNIKGYVEDLGYKTDGVGKIRLTEDYEDTDENGKLKMKIAKGLELEYTAAYSDINLDGFYIPAKKTRIDFLYGMSFDYIKEAKYLIKTKGYIGEGLYGEKKEDVIVTPEPEVEETPEPVIEEEDKPVIENKMSTRDIIIISLLGGIFLALMAIVIIKLVNNKKKTPIVKPVEEKKEEKSEIEIARETIEKRLEKEKEVKLVDEINKIEEKEDNKDV